MSRRGNHCPYCGLAPCVGDRCPQFDDYDGWQDGWDDLSDDHEPEEGEDDL